MRAGLSSHESSSSTGSGAGGARGTAELRRELAASAERIVRAERTRVLEGRLAKARGRLERRVRALEGDLERIAHADTLAQRAQLFVVDAARAPRGTSRLKAVDWSSGEPIDVTLNIDP